jgi:outer membrane protein assembly factor BamB
VTDTAKVWHVGGSDFHRTIATVAIHDGLVYAADLSGFVYCFDAKTGQRHWRYDTAAAIWGSPFVADGKVYIGDEDGDVAVLRAGKTLEVLSEINLGAAVYTTPVADQGTLYIVSRTKLFALRSGIPAKAPQAAAGNRQADDPADATADVNTDADADPDAR